MTESMDTPDHPVGSRWLWTTDGCEDAVLIVVKVWKKAIKFEQENNGMLVTMYDKSRALRSKSLVRLSD